MFDKLVNEKIILRQKQSENFKKIEECEWKMKRLYTKYITSTQPDNMIKRQLEEYKNEKAYLVYCNKVLENKLTEIGNDFSKPKVFVRKIK